MSTTVKKIESNRHRNAGGIFRRAMVICAAAACLTAACNKEPGDDDEKGDIVCEVAGKKYASLDKALEAVATGQTLRLLADVESGSIRIYDKNITLDLNGFTLHVVSFGIYEEAGITVDGGALALLNPANGALNVTSLADGVYARDGGSATVTNVTTNGGGYCAHAKGANSKVEVIGDAAATKGSGAYAEDGGYVKAGGNILVAEGWYGAHAKGANSKVEVTGNVTAPKSHGAYAEKGGYVKVGGNVEGGFEGAYADGANSKTEITGDVTARFDGAEASGGGYVKVSGNVTGVGGGAYAYGENSKVEVGGDATCTNNTGAYAKNGGYVKVGGNATGGNCGAEANGGGAKVEVGGNATSNGINYKPCGAVALDGEITVNGVINITAPADYIIVNDVKKAIGANEATSSKPGYREYKNATSYVWVKQ